jgi:hypothetical protein
LNCKLIIELDGYEKEQKLRGRFAGIVLKVSREEKKNTFISTAILIKFQMELPQQKLTSSIAKSLFSLHFPSKAIVCSLSGLATKK